MSCRIEAKREVLGGDFLDGSSSVGVSGCEF